MKETGRITRFGLVRHAETLWNLEKRIQGQSDSALTPDGEKQAETWGIVLKHFGWDRILASDSGRALITAGRINRYLGVPLISDLRLREQNWGDWTAKTVPRLEIEASRILAEQKTAGWNFRPPRGEDRLSVWERSRQALVDAAQKWPGQTVMVVTHEGVIKSLIYRLSGRRYLPDEPPLLKSYYLHWLEVKDQGLQIGEINALALE